MRVLPGADRRGGRRGLIALSALALAAGIVPLGAGTAVGDDDRDAVEQEKDRAAASISALKEQVTDIDAELAGIFVELESLNTQIPVAQAALQEAQSRFEAADREHEVALSQLESAQAERGALDAQVAQARASQEEATQAIAGLARQMYKDGSASAVALALTAEGSASIDQRAAAADALSRTQAQALHAALDSQASQRTRVARQEAITERIAALEETARRAAQEAQEAQDEAAAHVVELDGLKERAQAAQAQWDSRKEEAVSQLAQAEADYQAKAAELAAIDERNRAERASYTSASGMRNPVDNMTVTSPFGWRTHPVLGYAKFHQGVDFGAACGDKVYAVADGVVSAVSSSVSAGTYVDVNHGMMGGESTLTEYLHLQAVYVSPGQSVSAGTVLGEVGMTGYATGCHLHFGVTKSGAYVDPLMYL
ncbi:peptidoglycan DD-metalloendopeptidase family protein [Actinomyces sp. B33]|uniref:M23 family metallopeptidase n=1 Tax=Actinomyces sp. B33 TaxID=2942131 RepID=UPI00234086EC|nr:M23 family metallopeptidase [Actinomyces sp. B33]MDC4233814.1 peptidoglycan DD-metalloendopeptidase family protein [Actinomyces sp. B33]